MANIRLAVAMAAAVAIPGPEIRMPDNDWANTANGRRQRRNLRGAVPYTDGHKVAKRRAKNKAARKARKGNRP